MKKNMKRQSQEFYYTFSAIASLEYLFVRPIILVMYDRDLLFSVRLVTRTAGHLAVRSGTEFTS